MAMSAVADGSSTTTTTTTARVGVWVLLLATVATVLQGCSSDDTPPPQPDLPSVGGVLTDPNHFKGHSFAGTRFISDSAFSTNCTSGDLIWLVGSDDGQAFWSINGSWTDRPSGKLQVDFSPKGGPAALKGTASSTGIVWEDGNQWSYIQDLPFLTEPMKASGQDWAGLYRDTQSLGDFVGTKLAGTRMVSHDSPTPEKNIVIIAVDDSGSTYFMQGTTKDEDKAKFELDTGTGETEGTIADNGMLQVLGHTWQKQGPKSEIQVMLA